MLLLAPSCVPRLPFAVSAAEGKLAEAETLQGTVASTMSGTLERKMGIATNKIQMSVQDLVRSWDINKDGDIQPIEFRKAIRNSLKIQATNQEIDDLFKSLDLDGMQRHSNATPLEARTPRIPGPALRPGLLRPALLRPTSPSRSRKRACTTGGGTLDLKEMKVALSRFAKAAAEGEAEAEQASARATALREWAAMLVKAAGAVRQVGMHERQVAMAQGDTVEVIEGEEPPPVGTRVGRALMKQAVKSDKLMAAVTDNGDRKDGTIESEAFCRSISQAAKLEGVTHEDLASYYNQLCAETKSKPLSVKLCVRILLDTVNLCKDMQLAEAKSLKEAKAIAKQLVKDVHAVEKAEQDRQLKLEQEREAATLAKMAEVQAAQDRAAEEKAAAKAKKEAERAAFQAKVAQRRSESAKVELW